MCIFSWLIVCCCGVRVGYLCVCGVEGIVLKTMARKMNAFGNLSIERCVTSLRHCGNPKQKLVVFICKIVENTSSKYGSP